jgi:hypothetical protein
MPVAALLQFWPLSMLGQGSLYVELSGLSGGSLVCLIKQGCHKCILFVLGLRSCRTAAACGSSGLVCDGRVRDVC